MATGRYTSLRARLALTRGKVEQVITGVWTELVVEVELCLGVEEAEHASDIHGQAVAQ